MTSHDRLPHADALPMPDPVMLDASAAAAVHDILTEAAPANTARSYANALRYWVAWFAGRY